MNSSLQKHSNSQKRMRPNYKHLCTVWTMRITKPRHLRQRPMKTSTTARTTGPLSSPGQLRPCNGAPQPVRDSCTSSSRMAACLLNLLCNYCCHCCPALCCSSCSSCPAGLRTSRLHRRVQTVDAQRHARHPQDSALQLRCFELLDHDLDLEAGGASQPAEPRTQMMVVPKEHTAQCIRRTICDLREKKAYRGGYYPTTELSVG